MQDIMSLLGGGGQQVRVGTVTQELGKNKYRIQLGADSIVAHNTLTEAIKKGIPAIVTLTDKGWYIMGQPKNMLSVGSTSVVVSG